MFHSVRSVLLTCKSFASCASFRSSTYTGWGVLWAALLLIVDPGMPRGFAEEEQPHPGKALYAMHCASCHGERGEGVEGEYSQALVGDLSIRELSSYISAAMPEGEPEVCTGPDAQAVAEYIHGDFYSILAQVRNRPPEIDLSRLTVRQYRQSLTDLAGSFTWQGNWDDKRGLTGKYYHTRRRNKENLKIDRLDGVVDFRFGPEGPGEEIGAEEYSIEWRGGLLAPDTGWYDITFETENAGQLWLNDMRQPLIDARVKSGDQKEYRESLFLLGGRVYPLRLDFNKSKSEETGSVRLKWRRPHGSEELIASRYLSPNPFNRQIVVQRDFPPDDKSVGYERGVAVSKEWHEATTFAAIEFADKLLERIHDLAKLPKEQDQQAAKLREFCVEFAGRAFRRPLTPELQALMVDRQFESSEDPFTATKRVILLTLKSPRFLFPGAAAEEFDDYRIAEWLALTLWDSLPDEQLLRLAREGKLQTREQIAEQARRMVGNFRARTKMRGFFEQWLHFEHFHELSKLSQSFPEFDAALAADLRSSAELFVEDIVWSQESDYRRLLLADEAYLNGRLARFYGLAADLPEEADFQKVTFDPEHRAGILSHPYLLAGLAYEDASSPIHRGVFLARSLLGRFLKPPPIAISPVPPDLHPDLTTRERVVQQTSEAMCASCHGMINPLGFALEHFDAAGRFRPKDRNKPVDAVGVYIDRTGEEHRFDGARQLAQFLVGSQEAHAAFTEQLFQYLVKQPIQAFGPETHTQLREGFVQNQYHIRRLMAEIATESALQAQQIRQSRKK